MAIRHIVAESPLGAIIVVANGAALSGLYFAGQRYQPAESAFGPRADAGEAPFARVTAELAEYFAGSRTSFDVELALAGNDFQRRVWAELRTIEYGQRATYGAIALRLGNPRMAQAVGAAVGRNPVSIIVPCHRVVGSTGKLTGYAGGLDRKQALLDLEGPARLC
jgi:methylated-DNA-[protein]-cysteine S-methyltransferase